MATSVVSKTVQPSDAYDPLDMNSYSLNRIPKRPLSAAGRVARGGCRSQP